ncbi:YfkD famly protein [Oceanobacillus chungangensis]|uniref:YfkD-like protein n=1 Tax=Oceanobacillus chungangensis TaxID=1229152 RepID=A0A3D8PM86_9BACI|nr:YfkD famly protein [Oceanobacillus chungangensis]RDW17200.1 hypothetical protein CWR45_12455 [Oceanobacillus chungangensis]
MKKLNHVLAILMTLLIIMTLPLTIFAEEKEKTKVDSFKIPSHVLNISKENTFPNSSEDQEIMEPSEEAQELLDGIKVSIENPDLIKLLNETSIKPSPVGIGYRGMIYLGRWPLNYASKETTINWEYQPINTNELNNLGGNVNQEMNYVQQTQKEIKGALTNKVSNPEEVKKMMLLKSSEKTKLPLAYTSTIGSNTKKNNKYVVPVNKYGYLHSFAPAVNEKGQVTFGEVYIELKGTKKRLVIKNVTKQGIGAWIPIQDYVSFSYLIK